MHNRRRVVAMLAAGLPAASLLLQAAQAATAPTAAPKAAPKAAGNTGRLPDDIVLGNPKAPVTVIEYASLGCAICARFNNEIFSDFKKKYVDSGQVRFIGKELLGPNPALATAGYLLARCAGQAKYYTVIDAIYRAREDMVKTGLYREGLVKIAGSVGISEARFDACTKDEAALAALDARVKKNDGEISYLPTFFVNGQMVGQNFMYLDELGFYIAEARPLAQGQ